LTLAPRPDDGPRRRRAKPLLRRSSRGGSQASFALAGRIPVRPAALTALCFLGGVAFATWSFGIAALDPTSVQWLLAADRGQSFIGWHMARREPATFPLGGIPSYVYPLGASLAYTDSYPWFSSLLLLASPLLGDVFQHAGLWLALSYGLLAAFSFRLLRLLTGDDVGSAVASAVVVVNPVLLFRQFHLSLCAHWLIVAALLAYFLRARRTGIPPDGAPASPRTEPITRHPPAFAALLVAVASGTHPYLAVMVFGILCAAAWVGRRSAASAALEVGFLAIVAAAALYAFGYFAGAQTAAAGFGELTANLLTLVDPNGWSRVIPDLPGTTPQFEGFAYLGLAPLLMVAFAGIAAAARGLRRLPPAGVRASFRWRPLLVVLGGFAVFAIGSHPRLGRLELFALGPWYAVLEPIPSTFRASGRFVWPAYYAILFSILALLRRSVSTTAIYIALCVVALAAQAVDAWPRYSTQGAEVAAGLNRLRPLQDPAWSLARGDYDEIRLLPPAILDPRCEGRPFPTLSYIPFALLAGQHGMRINSGHLSRYPAGVADVCREQVEAVAGGRLDPRVVYVVARSLYESTPVFRSSAASCGMLDGYRVCVAASPITELGKRLLESP
jgi:hypothetical protein